MTYHAFLSFGEDTRKNFTDHLYTALSGAGFRTFRDDDGMERGKNVKSELDKAIKEARSSIVVFSKYYAFSGWCLDELVMILKRMRTSSGAGHVVLPVFYDVDPSQVRKQTGSFGEAFRRHEEQLNEETNEQKKEYLREKVQVWKRALKEVADLSGMVLQNQADGHEAKFIQKIVRVIGNELNRHVLRVAHNLIGIESRARNINSWLQDDQSNVGIAVICGMGGIGKTTIAKFVYNLNIERFEASSFLANIGKFSQGPEGLVRLQRQLLSDILKRKQEKIWSVDEGMNKIKNVIHCKRVLVVLDDVDDRAQFDATIGMLDWFHPGSKIILTTRYTHLLKGNEVDETFKVVGLGFDESLELFSWHAFGQEHPIEGYTGLSQRVIQHCGGLPLALQVLGSTLSVHSLDIWEDTLQKLADIPHSKILKKLQISYDYLDDNDKELFLHIACFFIGKGKDFVARILGDLYPKDGIQTLVERCLLTINGHNKLMMHQLLRQMGIEIVRQESPKEPGKRSRLWHHKDSFKVLSEKTGTETIEGLYLDMHHVLEEDSHHVMEKDSLFKENFGISKVKRPRFEELNHGSSIAEYGYSLKRHCLSLFQWRPTNKIERSADQVELTTDAFTRMPNLKLLHLNNVYIKGRYADFPGGLRCLTWHGFPLKSIPTEFSLKKLIDLDLHYSKLEQVWKGKMFLTSLKILNLSHSYGLKKTPNFTGVPNLEKLVLKYCLSLVEVHETIGELGSLVLLNLKGCINLKKLPKEIGHLTSIETLILSGCSKLDQLPAELGQMKSITVLHADGISQDIGKDGSWTSLIWSKVLNRRKSPKILPSLPGTLVELSLSNCSLSSDDLEKWLGHLSVLKNLDLSNNPISSLPESIKGLAVLQSLSLHDCKRLQSLPELPMTLEKLDVSHCTSLKVLPNLPNPFKNNNLTKSGGKIVEIKGMFKLEPLGNVDPEIISEMGLSSELETMRNLEMVEFQDIDFEVYESQKKGPLQEYIRDLEREEEEQMKIRMEELRKAECKNRDEFRKLMEEHVASGVLTPSTHWRDYCMKVKDLPAYLAVSSNTSGSTAKDLFEDVAGELQKQYVEDKARIKDAMKLRKIALSSTWTLEDFKAALIEDITSQPLSEINLKLVFDELQERVKKKEQRSPFEENSEIRRKRRKKDHHDGSNRNDDYGELRDREFGEDGEVNLTLQKLVLRNCKRLMELPPGIGELTNLEVLDLEGTEILFLPKEIAKLVNLTCLKVSFYGHANQTVIPRRVLSNLSRLNELIIDVTPCGEWWDVEVEAIIDDICSLKELRTLKLYLPTAELLEKLTLMVPGLTNFRFTVGRYEEHFISRLRHDAEEEFNNAEKLEKCLKYINGSHIPNEITKVIKHANAFFLQRHWTAGSLSEFRHENMNELKFFLVMECNEFRTIIDSELFYQGKDGRGETEDLQDLDESIVLGSLERLIIRYMKNMVSFWKGPVGKGSLANLKFLSLHTCPNLTTLFTIDMLSNLRNLEELIVEDCPKIDSLVSPKSSGSKSDLFLPSLKKISLLELPELVSISSGLCIAPKLERMVIFYCPKLEKLSAMDVSSENLKVIKGEKEWWDALKWYESDLSKEHEDYLTSRFIPLRRNGDLFAQLTKD